MATSEADGDVRQDRGAEQRWLFLPQEAVDRPTRALSATALKQEISRLALYQPEGGETAE